jgi:membrane protein implicated in regulation of membrane protease activity
MKTPCHDLGTERRGDRERGGEGERDKYIERGRVRTEEVVERGTVEIGGEKWRGGSQR